MRYIFRKGDDVGNPGSGERHLDWRSFVYADVEGHKNDEDPSVVPPPTVAKLLEMYAIGKCPWPWLITLVGFWTLGTSTRVGHSGLIRA